MPTAVARNANTVINYFATYVQVGLYLFQFSYVTEIFIDPLYSISVLFDSERRVVCCPPNVIHAEAGPSCHWNCCLIWLVGMLDHWRHICVVRTIAMLILHFLKFRNRTFLISWRGFLQGCLASLPSTSSHDTTKGHKLRRWSRQAWMYVFFFSRSWKEGLLPVSDESWMVHQDS